MLPWGRTLACEGGVEGAGRAQHLDVGFRWVEERRIDQKATDPGLQEARNLGRQVERLGGVKT